MEQNEVLNDIMALCDSIVSTNNEAEYRAMERRDNVVEKFKKWNDDFFARYDAVFSKICELCRICGNIRKGDLENYKFAEWKVSFKNGNKEFQIEGNVYGIKNNQKYIRIYRFVDGFSRGCANSYYILNGDAYNWETGILSDFLESVNFVYFDSVFANKLAELAKIISEHTQEISKI